MKENMCFFCLFLSDLGAKSTGVKPPVQNNNDKKMFKKKNPGSLYLSAPGHLAAAAAVERAACIRESPALLWRSVKGDGEQQTSKIGFRASAVRARDYG